MKKMGVQSVVKSFSRTSSMIQNFNRAGIRATEGTLRLEVQLGSSASYTFQINENQTKLATEIRLRQGDAFVPTSIGFFIKKAGTSSSTAPTDAQQSTADIHTFPDSTIFTGANEATNLNCMYNGRLQFNVNSVNLTETIDTLRYKRVGVAQQGLAVSTAASNNAYLRSQWDSADYGFQTFHQSIALNGQANNLLNLLLPTGVDCSGTASMNYAVIILRGTLLINGAGKVEDASIKSFLR